MISLYEISVENHIRAIGGAIGVLKKAAEHFKDNTQELNDIVSMTLAPDMLPFSFQVNSIRHHSLHAAQGILNGEFLPPEPLPEMDFAGLINMLEEAKSQLKEINRDEIEACSGKPVTFKMGSMQVPFTAENFVQSFSLPNLYFHSATAYDMLRMKGVPLGKQDFLGRMKIGLPG